VDVLIVLTLVVMTGVLLLAFVPIVPASALQWTLALILGALTGFERVTVPAVVIITIWALLGSTSGLWLPFFGIQGGKRLSCLGLIAFMLGAAAGTAFIPIPVVGTVAGGVGAVTLVELARVGQVRPALRGGALALRLMVLGFVLEFVFSLAILVTVIASVALTA
jgi:hypothetical protein